LLTKLQYEFIKKCIIFNLAVPITASLSSFDLRLIKWESWNLVSCGSYWHTKTGRNNLTSLYWSGWFLCV